MLYRYLLTHLFSQFALNVTLISSRHGNRPWRQILLPRVEKVFALHAVDTSFLRNELGKHKISKPSGLDKIPAKLLQDAASVVAKPVTYRINLPIPTGEIPSQGRKPE